MGSRVRIGLMGLGTVGTGVYEVLQRSAGQIARRSGGPVEITRVLVRDEAKARAVDVPPDVPFAGAKQSGLGAELGQEGLEEFTQAKIVNVAR